MNTSDKAHAKHFQHLQNDQKANLNIRFKLERTSLSKAIHNGRITAKWPTARSHGH
ncbi:hypothetical protein XF_0076 [Xylella fastidiosa 9a5c]|uniref:Uncharacterized protein n=1 Tax=Xylella fastidiosa (strain 9a5c) TaxID=160492 RepID=Q9PH70_XYLFA|nr:hypothetical protein XF_0076 [Xylella fastidiosa 9a5c]